VFISRNGQKGKTLICSRSARRKDVARHVEAADQDRYVLLVSILHGLKSTERGRKPPLRLNIDSVHKLIALYVTRRKRLSVQDNVLERDVLHPVIGIEAT